MRICHAALLLSLCCRPAAGAATPPSLDVLAEDIRAEPMFYFESALLKVREAALPEIQNNAVFSGNARRLLAL